MIVCSDWGACPKVKGLVMLILIVAVSNFWASSLETGAIEYAMRLKSGLKYFVLLEREANRIAATGINKSAVTAIIKACCNLAKGGVSWEISDSFSFIKRRESFVYLL